MTTYPVPFDFESHPIRVMTDEQGEPWFVAADVCHVLNIRNGRMALSRLDNDEKGVSSMDTLGGAQDMTIVNEPGLYSLVLGSRKPEAKRFKRWVTHEVLPAIRKTGKYATAGAQDALPAPTHDYVASILMIGHAVARVPGVKPGMAMAATLTCIHDNTGLAVEHLRRALPAADTPSCSLNATQLGKLLKLSARAVNLRLAHDGLQIRNDRDEWELTERGQAWGQALPYSRQGHSGYQVLWSADVADLIRGDKS